MTSRDYHRGQCWEIGLGRTTLTYLVPRPGTVSWHSFSHRVCKRIHTVYIVMSERDNEHHEGGTGTGVDLQADIAAIADTCTYIATTVSNLQDQLQTMDPVARQKVEELNAALLRTVLKDTSQPGAGLREAGAPGNSFAEEGQAKGGMDPSLACHSSSAKKREVFSLAKGGSSGICGIASGVKQPRKESSSTASDSDTAGAVGPAPRSSRGRPKVKEVHTPLSTEGLLQVLSRLDTRTVPKPEQYDLASGQPIEEFLEYFEEYCQGTFRGSSSLWIPELGRLLAGSIKTAFTALKSPGDSYEVIKKKLVSWCREQHQNVQQSTK